MSTTTAPRRRGRAAALLVVVAAAATASVVAVTTLRPHHGASPGATPHGPAATAHITRQTLVNSNTLSGDLGYGAAAPIRSKTTGTITWLPETGATVARGDTLLRADNLPVVLLYGGLPMYRPLALDTKGPDVEQFERNLAALGYTGFTVDDRYTDGTVAAVKRWQHRLGLPETGQVAVNQVIYTADAVRISGRLARIGADAGGDVLSGTASTRVVTVQVRATDAAWAVTGRQVQVTVPGGQPTAAVVAGVGGDATAAQSSGEGSGSGTSTTGGGSGGAQNATLPVTLTVADQRALGTLEHSPVDVRYTTEERKDVLTVPVAALLALAEGGYGLELVDGTGATATTRTVAVHTGLFADGLVEVSGPDLAPGRTVGLPG